ncbi:hypothetical protein BKA56DRAFT_621120 [Ilyonectria sp. MPI-CAGE-AT-0026]|nr:hypothetical protein BKA56DRAFT_621120 [Ilyonectria sp. MPI-CAGE-AT-0026]
MAPLGLVPHTNESHMDAAFEAPPIFRPHNRRPIKDFHPPNRDGEYGQAYVLSLRGQESDLPRVSEEEDLLARLFWAQFHFQVDDFSIQMIKGNLALKKRLLDLMALLRAMKLSLGVMHYVGHGDNHISVDATRKDARGGGFFVIPPNVELFAACPKGYKTPGGHMTGQSFTIAPIRELRSSIDLIDTELSVLAQVQERLPHKQTAAPSPDVCPYHCRPGTGRSSHHHRENNAEEWQSDNLVDEPDSPTLPSIPLGPFSGWVTDMRWSRQGCLVPQTMEPPSNPLLTVRLPGLCESPTGYGATSTAESIEISSLLVKGAENLFLKGVAQKNSAISFFDMMPWKKLPVTELFQHCLGYPPLIGC